VCEVGQGRGVLDRSIQIAEVLRNGVQGGDGNLRSVCTYFGNIESISCLSNGVWHASGETESYMYCSCLNWFQLMELSASVGIVPDRWRHTWKFGGLPLYKTGLARRTFKVGGAQHLPLRHVNLHGPVLRVVQVACRVIASMLLSLTLVVCQWHRCTRSVEITLKDPWYFVMLTAVRFVFLNYFGVSMYAITVFCCLVGSIKLLSCMMLTGGLKQHVASDVTNYLNCHLSICDASEFSNFVYFWFFF